VEYEDASKQSAEIVLDMPALEARLPELRERYASAQPFPHIVLDEFVVREVAKRATDEFPPGDPELWINYLHLNERKYANRDAETWGPSLRSIVEFLNSARFVEFLSELTGIKGLFIDKSMEGGGLHRSLRGGFLNIHTDFTVHPHHRHWRRRVNLLLYFNDEWPADYGGELEFWSADMKRRERTIAPVGNRVVIFNTDPDAFHGHPEPLRCPPGTSRQSMALYYFTTEKDPFVRSTEYRARPGDGWRALPIYLDKQALRTYDWVKRRLGLSDNAASGFLRRVEGFGRRWKR
jgi:hypothetical protein